MDKKEEILRLLPTDLRKLILKLNINFEKLCEIRLRINKPAILVYGNKQYFITDNGLFEKLVKDTYVATKTTIKEALEYISNYSLYAFEEEIRQGFITVNGGHRIGLCGKTVLENENVKTIKNISYINIRVAHEIKGCGNRIIKYINMKNKLLNTLIISPPGCGKTTLLRDIVRQLSDERYMCGIVDERSEIAACYLGVAQNDVGIRTDVIDCCPKTEGMLMLIRSMAPDLIAVDEIGKKEDIEALKYVINSGCVILATIHGLNIEDIISKTHINGMFKRYIVLSKENGVGNIDAVYDENFQKIG